MTDHRRARVVSTRAGEQPFIYSTSAAVEQSGAPYMTAARSAFLLLISERWVERGRCVRDEKVKARVREGEEDEQ